jgi:hypothetical protein
VSRLKQGLSTPKSHKRECIDGWVTFVIHDSNLTISVL